MAIRQDGNTYYGLSTDTKPTGAVLNGREFVEMDTGKKYLFDYENGEWLEQPEEGGGGGGGVLIVHQSHDEVHGIYTLDKTWKEIADAILVGPVLLLAEDDFLEYSIGSSPIQSVSIEDGSYWVYFANGSFDTDSENGYPSYQAD